MSYEWLNPLEPEEILPVEFQGAVEELPLEIQENFLDSTLLKIKDFFGVL